MNTRHYYKCYVELIQQIQIHYFYFSFIQTKFFLNQLNNLNLLNITCQISNLNMLTLTEPNTVPVVLMNTHFIFN
ncbi:hypothetical protein BpHYR1_001919 [Brachionus plicatilis]|uniref:Uncharacterized protein n=1 Tax=Brachionus plicatilis TaxID=10195 RepID=A0A3M7SDI5_BRAPC|nr:hypothetical protein BpHYR1_001919 [Brachionus plicatilis]